MNDSCLVPDFYVHPDYLLVDQVLDQIGRNIISGWDGDCIKTSKITNQIAAACEENSGNRRLLIGTEIAYLTPLQETTIRKIISSFKATGKIHTDQFPSKPVPFDEFLKKGSIGPFYLKSFSLEKLHGFYKNRLEGQAFGQADLIADLWKIGNNSKSRNNSKEHIFCNIAFLFKDVEIFNKNSSPEASDFEIIFGSIGFSPNDLEHENKRSNLNNLLNLTKVRNTLRDALVKGKLYSYTKQDGKYFNISPMVWNSEKAWCRLLIEGFQILFGGRVFFKKSEVKAFLENSLQALPCIDGQESRESWEKLFNPRKPWLKLMNELALSLSNEEIETKTKKELIRDIEKKVNSSGLIATEIKLESLATFLRFPEQEKGRTWRSNKKKQKAKAKQ